MAGVGSGRKGPDGARAPKPAGLPRGRLLLGGILFLVLTAAVFAYQFRRIGPGHAFPRPADLRWEFLVFLLLLLPMETLVSGLRMWVICRVLHPQVSYRTCVQAELANAGMAVLTPSQTGGGVGQVYLLARAGIGTGTALTVSLLTFLGTIVALAGMGAATLLSPLRGEIGPVFVAAALVLTGCAGLILFSAGWPGPLRAILSGSSRIYWRATGRRYPLAEGPSIPGPAGSSPGLRMGPWAARLGEVLHAYREDLARFLRRGKAAFAAACLLSVLFFLSRFLIAYCCVRFLGIPGSSPREILGIQAALLFVTYFGPTPGSAGIAEGASLAIMAGIVPPGFAPFYHLLWRFFTVYAAACAGLLLVLRAAWQDARRASRRPGRAGRLAPEGKVSAQAAGDETDRPGPATSIPASCAPPGPGSERASHPAAP